MLREEHFLASSGAAVNTFVCDAVMCQIHDMENCVTACATGLHKCLEHRRRTSFGLLDNNMMAIMYSLVLFTMCLSLVTPSMAQHRKKVLVLGGDGMLGSETVARLKLKGHDITILHRGSWYWDSSLRIKPWVNFVQCDRDRFNECADKLGEITREKGMFDAVIDFSGYKPSHVKVNSRPLLHT